MSDKLYYKEIIKKAAENHKWHNEPLNNINMDIKHGDVLTLKNGEVVKVSLEVIKPAKPIKKLKPGKQYKLRYSGQFCHYMNSSGLNNNDVPYDSPFIFVGTVGSNAGKRNIFYNTIGRSGYLMFGVGNLDYVVEEVEDSITF